MSVKFTTVPSKLLAESITAASTSFRLSNIKGWDTTDLVAGDFGTTHYVVFRNSTKTAIELMEIDPATIASANITITRRGLDFTGDLTTEVTANKLNWTKSDTYVDLGTDTPQMFQYLKEYIDGVSIAGAANASLTAKGIVELATLAQVRARTALGETGAAIAVTPDVLDDLPTQDEKAAMQGGGYLGTPSTSNKFVTENGFKNFGMIAGATINGATLPVPVYQNTSDNEVYACDGNDLAALKFIGFAISNSTDGVAIFVQTNGIVSGFTGLDEGVSYWLSDTVGTIQNTPGTYSVYVGIAVSSTQLLIQKGRRYFSGNGGSVGTANGSVVVNCGFRPLVVRIFAYSASTTSTASMTAVYANGVMTAVSSQYNEASTAIVSNAANLYGDSTTNYMAFTVGSITNTGATITWTEQSAFSNDGYFTYEIEGEI